MWGLVQCEDNVCRGPLVCVHPVGCGIPVAQPPSSEGGLRLCSEGGEREDLKIQKHSDGSDQTEGQASDYYGLTASNKRAWK